MSLIRDTWPDKGLCREKPHNLFFPGPVTEKSAKVDERARAICKRCPVVEDCLSHAMSSEPYGTWGGMTETEREVKRYETGMKLLIPTRERSKNPLLKDLT